MYEEIGVPAPLNLKEMQITVLSIIQPMSFCCFCHDLFLSPTVLNCFEEVLNPQDGTCTSQLLGGKKASVKHTCGLRS